MIGIKMSFATNVLEPVPHMPATKPSVLDFKLRDGDKPNHLADEVVHIIFDQNPEDAPRGMPAT
jgi:hypothetical protein